MCATVSDGNTLFFRSIGRMPLFFHRPIACPGCCRLPQAVHQDVWAEVYRFWKEKRSRLGKPLLRRFWPVTPSNDTDPHKVGRFFWQSQSGVFCVLICFVFIFLHFCTFAAYRALLCCVLCILVECNRCSPRQYMYECSERDRKRE